MPEYKDIRPKGYCPKCGIGMFGYPRYDVDSESGWDSVERIIWECNICGYHVITKTADAE